MITNEPSITVSCKQVHDGQPIIRYVKMHGCTELTRTIALDAMRITFGGGHGIVTQTLPYFHNKRIVITVEDEGNHGI